MSLSLTAAGGALPAAVQWSFSYSTADVASIVVSPGTAANSAGKTVVCAPGTGTQTCLVYGLNANVIGNGVVAQLAVNLSPTTQSASTAIQIFGMLASDPTGTAIPATGAGGVVTILPPVPTLAGLTCSTSTMAVAGNVSCTAFLTAAPSAGGFSVGLTSTSPLVTVPDSLSIPSGSVSANFTAAVSAFSTAAIAVITASTAGSISRTASITLSPALVSSLTCAQGIVPSGGSTTCTATLVSAAPQGGAGVPVSLSTTNTAVAVPASITVASGASAATFNAAASGVAVQEVWIAASVNGSSAQALVTVAALQLRGDPSELSGSSNGATVSPFVAAPGLIGQLSVSGAGTPKFAEVGSGEGVYFLNCCTNANMAYYQFTGVGLGSLFNLGQGQVSFTLKSSYTFTQRQTAAAAARYVFDVVDNPTAGHHLFYFLTGYTQNYLTFSYAVAGAAKSYYVPHGTENALFGNGAILQVTISWSNDIANLYLNGALVQSSSYTPSTASWSAGSVFDFGAMDNFNLGGYYSCDDKISAFTVGIPTQLPL